MGSNRKEKIENYNSTSPQAIITQKLTHGEQNATNLPVDDARV